MRLAPHNLSIRLLFLFHHCLLRLGQQLVDKVLGLVVDHLELGPGGRL